MAPEGGDLPAFGTRDPAQDRPRLAGPGEQYGALSLDDLEIETLADIDVEAAFELQEFALGDALDRGGKDLEDFDAAILDDHRRGPGIEEVPGQDGPLVAPDRIRGGPAPAQGRGVHDVVVEQGRGVQQFDRGGDPDASRPRIITEFRRQQEQGGAQAFASGAQQMGAQFGEQGQIRMQLAPQRPLHQGQGRLDPFEHPRKDQRPGLAVAVRRQLLGIGRGIGHRPEPSGKAPERQRDPSQKVFIFRHLWIKSDTPSSCRRLFFPLGRRKFSL